MIVGCCAPAPPGEEEPRGRHAGGCNRSKKSPAGRGLLFLTPAGALFRSPSSAAARHAALSGATACGRCVNRTPPPPTPYPTHPPTHHPLQTDHKCVLDSCRYLQQRGFEVTYLPVQKNGLIDLQQLEDAIRPETSLVRL